jgi:hypothetical protein
LGQITPVAGGAARPARKLRTESSTSEHEASDGISLAITRPFCCPVRSQYLGNSKSTESFLQVAAAECRLRWLNRLKGDQVAIVPPKQSLTSDPSFPPLGRSVREKFMEVLFGCSQSAQPERRRIPRHAILCTDSSQSPSGDCRRVADPDDSEECGEWRMWVDREKHPTAATHWLFTSALLWSRHNSALARLCLKTRIPSREPSPANGRGDMRSRSAADILSLQTMPSPLSSSVAGGGNGMCDA